MEELVCDSLFDVYDEDFIRNLVNEAESLDRSEIDKLVKRILKENHGNPEPAIRRALACKVLRTILIYF